jgi:hypothetical protein
MKRGECTRESRCQRITPLDADVEEVDYVSMERAKLQVWNRGRVTNRDTRGADERENETATLGLKEKHRSRSWRGFQMKMTDTRNESPGKARLRTGQARE